MLEKVLEKAKNNLIGVQFDQLVGQLKEQQLKSTGEIKIAAERSVKLADQLRELIALMREDPRQSKLRDEIANLKKIIEELDKIIHKQKVTQGITDANRTDKTELGKIQNSVSNDTKKLIAKLDGKGAKGVQGRQGRPQGRQGGPRRTARAATRPDRARRASPKRRTQTGQRPSRAKSQPGQPSRAAIRASRSPTMARRSRKRRSNQGQHRQQQETDRGRQLQAAVVGRQHRQGQEPRRQQDRGRRHREVRGRQEEAQTCCAAHEEELERTLADLLRRCERCSPCRSRSSTAPRSPRRRS